ncbi:hypothetical protein [Streptomyces cucumeris]|uniref:hypothetical protein n=1 Tax=Streptomyces cucumeris TaxID=2962890 RepID=UPI003D710839
MMSHDFPAVFFEATWRPETTHGFVLSSYALPPRGPARTATLTTLAATLTTLAATLTTLAAALAPGAVLALGEGDEEACDWGKPGGLATFDELTEAFTGLGLQIVRAEHRQISMHQHPGHEQEPAEGHAVIVIARRPHGTLETID